jgi:hypothetical protein
MITQSERAQRQRSTVVTDRDTSLVKVEKTGVYRNESGHAVQLIEGASIPKYVLDNYSFDKSGTDDAAANAGNTEFNFTGVVDASQDDFLAERAEQRPQTKSTAPASNKSDAQNASDAAK